MGTTILPYELIIISIIMAVRHAQLSQFLWYGLTGGIVYFGITAYKPRYFFTFANVQRI
jgi:hypothetical protein